MNVKKKSLIFSLMVLMVLVLFSAPTISADKQQVSSISPQTSQLTELPYVIRINDNWTETVAMYDWCTGSGTKEDPYIIQGINISIPDQAAQIAIKNSVEHFIIKNCSFSNIEFDLFTAIFSLTYHAGIYIEKAEYGLIENCTFTNLYGGVSIYEAESINITKSRFVGSHNDNETGFGRSIRINKAENISIINNYVINFYGGIRIDESEDCIIDHNYIENLLWGEPANGVYLDSVNNSAITNNDFVGCVATSQFSDVTISGLSTAGLETNTIIINPSCHNIRVYGNRFYDMDGNLIDGSTSIPAFDIPIILGTIVSIAIIGIMRRKKKIS